MEWIRKNILIILCFIGMAWLGGCALNECSHRAELEDEVTAVNTFWETEEQQWISRDSIQAQDIKELELNLMTETSARIILEEEFKRFQDIQSHTRVETVTEIKEILIPYAVHDTVIKIVDNYVDVIPVDTVKKHFVQIGTNANYKDKWLQLYTTIDTALTIDSMSLINKFDVTIGWKKPDKPFKFLRRKKPVVEVTSYNPWTQINYVNNVTIKDQPKGNWKGFGGFVAGFGSGYVTGRYTK